MYATLVGTNTGSTQIDSLFHSLSDVAINYGFIPPDTQLRIQRDQIPLDGWTLELKGTADGKADFLLAVTAPKVPGFRLFPSCKPLMGHSLRL